MLHSKLHIEEGDLVIVFFTRDNMTPITITKGQFLHNKYGRYEHDDMIGRKFGTKMHAPPPTSGYVHLLRPTPELWTLSLPHRTQILYLPDISFIIQRLSVRPGVTVVEAGTGSGSMTHSLSRAVGERGLIRSFEYHEARFKAANEEFKKHGLDNVIIKHGNVCKDGFGDAENVESVFLDLPAPWEAIPHAIKTFKPDVIARICCFSPCLEQVLKTVTALREYGFEDISTQEILARTHEIVQAPVNTTAPLRSVSEIVNGLKEHETKKQEKRAIQMRTAREKAQQKKATDAAKAAKDAAAVELETEGPTESMEDVNDLKRKHGALGNGSEGPSEDNAASKRSRSGLLDGSGDPLALLPATKDVDNIVEANSRNEHASSTNGLIKPIWTEPETNVHNFVLSKPSYDTRGHTSYLTFASFYPAAVRSQLSR